jgi:hypothetical protein
MNLSPVVELQVQIEAFGEEITGDMWYDILDNFVIHVQ